MRRRRPFAARVEPLEPRVVLTTTSALDPSFGTRGVVLGATSPADTNLSAATAVAVQADGKIVEVGQTGQYGIGRNPGLAVRRYNADGSVDTTFGTNGQANIPYSATSGQFGVAPKNVVVEPNGDIVLAAVAEYQYASVPNGSAPPYNSVVVRLTPAGQLDPGFGTGGEYVVAQGAGYLSSVAVQADGAVVAAGYLPATLGSSTSSPTLSVIRLTTAGALDATFNGTGVASVAFQQGDLSASIGNPALNSLVITPTGQILLGGSLFFQLSDSDQTEVTLAELKTDGTPNSSFGTGGSLLLTAAQSGALGALAVGPDGSILVAGTGLIAANNGTATTLVRLTATGAIDPTFPKVGPVEAGLSRDTVAAVALGTDGTITVAGTGAIGPSTYPFVARYLSTGAVDTAFGLNGRTMLNLNSTFATGSAGLLPVVSVNGLALAGGDILEVGSIQDYARTSSGFGGPSLGSQAFLAQVLPVKTAAVANDYDGDGKADLAGILAALAIDAYRPSSGLPDALAPFGSPGLAAIPAPGDYDGDGEADIAAYFPTLGELIYRPSAGGTDVVVPFGIPGAGNTIPAPGDYDGSGRTEVAAYFPALGEFVYRPASGAPDVVIPFGIPGVGNSIPAPGDYDGDGKTDPAVYLPSIGAFAYRPSSGGADVITQFGIAGAGGSIPAPGDYDGDGKTDLAVYLPALGDYAYRPSSGGADVITPFGIPGARQSIPTPGDYDGDGKTDLAVYLPSIGDFAVRPSSGGADELSQFGAAGVGQTVPAASIPAALATTVTAPVAASSAVVHDLALTDDLTSAEMAQARPKRKKTS